MDAFNFDSISNKNVKYRTGHRRIWNLFIWFNGLMNINFGHRKTTHNISFIIFTIRRLIASNYLLINSTNCEHYRESYRENGFQ